jgi:phenylacetate-CoA ligase
MVDPGRMIAELARCETLSRRDMRDYQRTLLTRMLTRARSNVKLYSDRLAVVFRNDGTIDYDRWAEVPLLTKEELITCGDDKFDADLPETLKPFDWSATSGTTAKPFLAAKTRFALFMSACINERLISWGGLDPRKPLAIIRFGKDAELGYPEGKLIRGWSIASPGTPSYTLSQTTTTGQQIDWLRRKRPAYLSAYPSVAAEIANLAGSEGVSLGIEAVLTFGEAVLDDHVAAIRDGLGARIVDAYSAQETGFIALQCPVSDHHHVVSSTILLEIVDDTGKPVPAGTEGEVVLTPFHNAVMPLVRYRIGDRGVMAAGRCRCGCTAPRLAAIGGRSRDMFRYADGSRQFANLLVPDLQKAVPNLQYQLVQHSPTDIELRYVPDPSSGRVVDLMALQVLARRDLHPAVTIRASAVAEIERTPGGKFQRTVRLF